MGATWETLQGDTSRFAVRLQLVTDLEPTGCAATEEEASWGGLQMWVDGLNLCAYADAGEPVHYTHWYLLPWLEWWVDNWDEIFHQERLPDQAVARESSGYRWVNAISDLTSDEGFRRWEAWSEWWNAHNLQAGRAGGLLPDVTVRRVRDELEITWDRTPVAGAPPDFVFMAGTGSSSVPVKLAASAVYEAVRGCVAELASRLPESGRVRALSERVEALTDPNRAERRVALLAGLDGGGRRWAKVKQELGKASEQACRRLLGTGEGGFVVWRAPQAAALYGTVSPTVGDDDLEELVAALLRCGELGQEPDPPDLDVFRNAVEQARADPPWAQGYALADVVHDELELVAPGAHYVSLEPLVEFLRATKGEIHLTDRDIRGVALVSAWCDPLVLTNASYPANATEGGARFSLAHELCHLLVDREDGSALGLASGPWAPLKLEQRANAFAAALLAPGALARRVAAAVLRVDRPQTLRDVGVIAREMKVGRSLLLEHLGNTGVVDGRLRQEWRDRLERDST